MPTLTRKHVNDCSTGEIAMFRGIALTIPLALVMSAASAEDVVPNTINCADFQKTSDGKWTVRQTTTFDAGAVKGMTIEKGTALPPRGINVGVDLYGLLDAKCRKAKPI